MFYRFFSILCLLIFCFLAAASAFAAEVAQSELISDPLTMAVAAGYVLLEFVLGKTTLVKANSVLELALRSVGRIVLATFGLKKYGFEMKD